MGPNGAGKTTTVEMFEGLTKPDSGTVELFGLPGVRGQDREMQERLGVQLQDTQLADKLMVEEVLRLFRRSIAKAAAWTSLVRELDLGGRTKQQYHKLSGGQKQRVALGTALAGDPGAALPRRTDDRARPARTPAALENRARLSKPRSSVLITTHYMEEAAVLCDRIAVMDHGKIIALGTPRSLVDGLGLVQFVEFEAKQAPDEAALSALPAVESVARRGDGYRLRIDRSLSALSSVLNELERQKVTPIGLSTHQATLDDVFLHLTGRALKNGEAGAQPEGAAP